ALRWGATRLPANALPVVLSMADSTEAPVQRAAIDALGNFSQPEASRRLEHFATHGTAEQSEAALNSLANSRFPSAHQTLLSLKLSSLPVSEERVIFLLSEYPRREWQDLFLKAARSDNRTVRLEALQTL